MPLWKYEEPLDEKTLHFLFRSAVRWYVDRRVLTQKKRWKTTGLVLTFLLCGHMRLLKGSDNTPARSILGLGQTNIKILSSLPHLHPRWSISVFSHIAIQTYLIFPCRDSRKAKLKVQTQPNHLRESKQRLSLYFEDETYK